MRIDDSLKIDRPYPGIPATRLPEFKVNLKSGVSREERLHLLADKAQSPAAEKSSNTYSERAQLLSNYSRTEHSWIV